MMLLWVIRVLYRSLPRADNRLVIGVLDNEQTRAKYRYQAYLL